LRESVFKIAVAPRGALSCDGARVSATIIFKQLSENSSVLARASEAFGARVGQQR